MNRKNKSAHSFSGVANQPAFAIIGTSCRTMSCPASAVATDTITYVIASSREVGAKFLKTRVNSGESTASRKNVNSTVGKMEKSVNSHTTRFSAEIIQ